MGSTLPVSTSASDAPQARARLSSALQSGNAAAISAAIGSGSVTSGRVATVHSSPDRSRTPSSVRMSSMRRNRRACLGRTDSCSLRPSEVSFAPGSGSQPSSPSARRM